MGRPGGYVRVLTGPGSTGLTPRGGQPILLHMTNATAQTESPTFRTYEEARLHTHYMVESVGHRWVSGPSSDGTYFRSLEAAKAFPRQYGEAMEWRVYEVKAGQYSGTLVAKAGADGFWSPTPLQAVRESLTYLEGMLSEHTSKADLELVEGYLCHVTNRVAGTPCHPACQIGRAHV